MPKATSTITAIAGALDLLVANIRASSQGNPEQLLTVHGWNNPHMTYEEVAQEVLETKNAVLELADGEFTESEIQKLSQMPQRVEYVRVNSAGNLWGKSTGSILLNQRGSNINSSSNRRILR